MATSDSNSNTHWQDFKGPVTLSAEQAGKLYRAIVGIKSSLQLTAEFHTAGQAEDPQRVTLQEVENLLSGAIASAEGIEADLEDIHPGDTAQDGAVLDKQVKKLIDDLSQANSQYEQERAAHEARQAEKDAAWEKHKHRIENPIEYLTNEDIGAIENRLSRILQSCYTINRIAFDAVGSDDKEIEGHALMAVAEMARANVKGLDACVYRLTGEGRTGIFEDEFSED